MGKKKILSIEEKTDQRISQFIGAYFIASTANMTMKTVLPIPNNLWSVVSLFWGCVIMFFMLRGIGPVLKRSLSLIIKSVVIFGLLFLWSYLLIIQRNEPTSVLVSGLAIPTIMFWLPIGIYACSVRDMQVLYHVILKTSYVLLGILIICFLFRNNIEKYGEEVNNYNMFFGYSIAFTSLIQLNEYFRSKRTVFLFLFILQVVLILLYANRGALLSISFFVFYKLVFDQTSLTKKIFWIIILIVGVTTLLLYMESIANAAINLLSRFNMESRTLQKMAAAEIAESEARDELRQIAISMIGERPVIGWGIGGECYTIGMRYAPGADLTVGLSPHNGILQHMLYFGVLAGNLVNILLIAPLFKLHRINDEYRHAIVLVCCSAGFITTLWSSCDILLKPVVAIYLFLSYFYKKTQMTLRVDA